MCVYVCTIVCMYIYICMSAYTYACMHMSVCVNYYVKSICTQRP